ncbi:MAG: tetratricopeptide repeat protein [Ketobacteraceae bacterium]|nr:tetratricopeptide repeat protein [Ketobacteraceae bacterium]
MPAHDLNPQSAVTQEQETETLAQTPSDSLDGFSFIEVTPDATPKKINIARNLNQAIAALGKGQRDEARSKVNEVLDKDPDNADALALLEQMDVNPVIYFGSEYFEYKARAGDSMTRIADRFLKDHLKFYILSRYSGIDNPASLVRGQTVRIPAQYKPAPKVARKQPSPAPAIDPALKKAEALLNSQQYVEVINLLEPRVQNNGAGDKALALIEQAYAGEAARLATEGELKPAKLLYRKAARVAGDSSAYDARIAGLSDQIKARDLQRLASLHLKSGQLDIAMENIRESLELVPDSNVSKSLYQRIKAGQVNAYHARALELFNDDRFEEALALWDAALELDPTHLLSKTYQERCKAVLERNREIALSYSDDQ